MKIAAILLSAEKYGTRFVAWLKFIMAAEATLRADGTIVVENDHDGAGLTAAGLNQKDDGLIINSDGSIGNTPQWFADTYRTSYWLPVHADQLPQGVGEETANIAVNEGTGEAPKILQESIVSLGITISEDGIIGAGTENAAAQEDAHQLCLKIAAYNDAHYEAIAAMRPDLRANLRGWLNRDQAMVSAFA